MKTYMIVSGVTNSHPFYLDATTTLWYNWEFDLWNM